MIKADDRMAFLVHHDAKSLTDILNTVLVKHGVTRVQWQAMHFIQQGASISQIELAEHLGSSGPTVTGILDRLEKDKLIQRIIDNKDKRKKLLVVTAKGKEKHESLLQIAEDFHLACVGEISDKDQVKFLSVLNQLVANAESWLKEKSDSKD